MKIPVPVPAPTRRSRKGGFGPGEWLLLGVPILSGSRMRLTDGSSDNIATADLLVEVAGPGLVVLAFAVGACARVALPHLSRNDPKALARASTLRMAALLVAFAIGLRLVFPFDLVTPGGPWRSMAAWGIGVALPMWAAGMYALVRGRSTPVAILASLGLGATPTLIAFGCGLYYSLPIGALLLPATAAGLVAGAGAALAAWFGVSAPGWIVLATVAAVAVGPGWVVAHHHARPPFDTLAALGLTAFDSVGHRIAIELGRPDTHTLQLAEITLDTGKVELLTPLDRGLVYAAGTRVTTRRSGWQQSTNRLTPRSLCRETAPNSRQVECRRGVLPRGGGVILSRHPLAAFALATVPDRILVWDLGADRLSEVIEPDARVWWPCFQPTRAVLYRLQEGPGPFSHHSLDLVTGESTRLLEGHDVQCAPDVPVETHAQLIRGRLRLAKPSRLIAPSLQDGEVTLEGNLSLAKWSGDGSAVAFLFDRPAHNLAVFSEAWGLIPPLQIPPTPDISLSEDGSMVAYAIEPTRGRWEIVLAELPSGKFMRQVPADQHQMFWDGSRLLFLQARRLVRIDPRTGRQEVLFPPAS